MTPTATSLAAILLAASALAASVTGAQAQDSVPPGVPAPLVHPKPAAARPAAPKPVVALPPVLPAAKHVATPVAPPAAKPAAPPSPPTVSSIPLNRNTILLDPGHGGVDTGARITDSLLEKDVTLALAFKLRSLLTARGFTVVMTREDDASSPTPLTLDDRAGLANHAHPVACLMLHATASGNGVHLYSSELDAAPYQPISNPWLTAQAPWVTQSQYLEKAIAQALTRSNIAIVMSRASVRPVDSLTCPALVVEVAPSTSDASTVNDGDYQDRIANALATTLLLWKSQAQPPASPPAPLPSLSSTPPPAGVTP